MDIEKKKEELKNKERHYIHDLVDIMVLEAVRGTGNRLTKVFEPIL